MPKPKQTREVAEFKGADKKNPQRYRNTPPKHPKKLLEAPSHLTTYQAKIWRELRANALPNILTASDAYVFEVTAKLLASFRKEPETFTSANYGHLIRCLQLLGMTPVDRQRLHVAKPTSTNDFDEYNQ